MSDTGNELSEKWNEWREAFDGKDKHSINKQIFRMLFDSAIWKTINSSRNDETHRGNVMIHNFIDRSFFGAQMLAIRQLVDNYPFDDKKKNKNDVVSLVSILEDIKDQETIVTRENILLAENEIRAKAEAHYQKQIRKGKLCYRPPEPSSVVIEARFKSIDHICGVDRPSRSLEDTVSGVLLDRLIERINNASKAITSHVNKFLAHSSTEKSRQELIKDGYTPVTLNHLNETQKTVCEVAGALGRILYGHSQHGFMPTFNYDQFRNIDAPFVRSEDVDRLREEWDVYTDVVNTWAIADELFQEIGWVKK